MLTVQRGSIVGENLFSQPFKGDTTEKSGGNHAIGIDIVTS
jgi:hypothetical protein